jgi:hypothetical protein
VARGLRPLNNTNDKHDRTNGDRTMGLDDLDRRMAQLDDQLDGARKYADDAGGNWLPDPGTYQGILNDVDFFEQKKPPRARRGSS